VIESIDALNHKTKGVLKAAERRVVESPKEIRKAIFSAIHGAPLA
jgi:hypothetical protein